MKTEPLLPKWLSDHFEYHYFIEKGNSMFVFTSKIDGVEFKFKLTAIDILNFLTNGIVSDDIENMYSSLRSIIREYKINKICLS